MTYEFSYCLIFFLEEKKESYIWSNNPQNLKQLNIALL